MLRAQHVGLLGLGFFLVACQGPDEYFRGVEDGVGQAGSGPSGVAGAVGTGVAGSGGPTGVAGMGPTGVAGSIATGTAGTSAGGTGGDGSPGMAGTSGGAAGTSGGTAGTSGAAGRGGTTGAGGGQGGSSGRGGTTGSAGRGGATGMGGGGAGGRGGRGGTTGAAGRGGTTGSGGGGNSCPLGGQLNCTAAGALQMTPDGQIVDFSAGQWNNMTSKFCDAHGLDGGISSYAGTGSTATAAVDTMAGNLRLSLMVSAGQYAGGRLNFDSCVNAGTFNSVQFTVAVASGSLTNCSLQVQIQTQDKRPTTATNPSGGTCASNCEQYPAAVLNPQPTGATATTVTTPFSSFNNASSVATASQISGLQWQVNSGNNGSGTCTVELRIDNVRLVTM